MDDLNFKSRVKSLLSKAKFSPTTASSGDDSLLLLRGGGSYLSDEPGQQLQLALLAADRERGGRGGGLPAAGGHHPIPLDALEEEDEILAGVDKEYFKPSGFDPCFHELKRCAAAAAAERADPPSSLPSSVAVAAAVAEIDQNWEEGGCDVGGLDQECIDKHRKRLLKQLKVVTRRTFALILDQRPKCVQEMAKIQTLSSDIDSALLSVRCGRLGLSQARHRFTKSSLGILAAHKRRQRAATLLRHLQIISTLQQTDARLQELLDQGNYPGAIMLLIEGKNAVETYQHFSAIQELSVKLEDTLEMTEETLDVALSKVCVDFERDKYRLLVEAYACLGSSAKIHSSMDQLLMHVTSAIHNSSWNVVYGHASLTAASSSSYNAANQNKQAEQGDLSKKLYKDVCSHLATSSLLPCLVDLCRTLWNIMNSYRKIVTFHCGIEAGREESSCHKEEKQIADYDLIRRKLKMGLTRIWQDVQTKVKLLIGSSDVSALSIDQFIKIIDVIHLLIQVGQSFCSISSSSDDKVSSTNEDQVGGGGEAASSSAASRVLQDSLKVQCLSYFESYHRERLQDLKMHLDHENWSLCPVKQSFNLFQLQEFSSSAAAAAAAFQNDRVAAGGGGGSNPGWWCGDTCPFDNLEKGSAGGGGGGGQAQKENFMIGQIRGGGKNSRRGEIRRRRRLQNGSAAAGDVTLMKSYEDSKGSSDENDESSDERSSGSSDCSDDDDELKRDFICEESIAGAAAGVSGLVTSTPMRPQQRRPPSAASGAATDKIKVETKRQTLSEYQYPPPPQYPVITTTSLMLLRLCGKYLHLMQKLQPIATSVFIAMTQLIDFYFINVHSIFSSDLSYESHHVIWSAKYASVVSRISTDLLIQKSSPAASTNIADSGGGGGGGGNKASESSNNCDGRGGKARGSSAAGGGGDDAVNAEAAAVTTTTPRRRGGGGGGGGINLTKSSAVIRHAIGHLNRSGAAGVGGNDVTNNEVMTSSESAFSAAVQPSATCTLAAVGGGGQLADNHDEGGTTPAAAAAADKNSSSSVGLAAAGGGLGLELAELNHQVDLSQPESLHGLRERVVATESVVYIARQIRNLQLKTLITKALHSPATATAAGQQLVSSSDANNASGGGGGGGSQQSSSSSSRHSTNSNNAQQLVADYFAQTLDVMESGEVRRPVLMSVAQKAIGGENVLKLMAKVNWDIKEVHSQHNHYVDIMLRELQVLSMRLDQLDFGISAAMFGSGGGGDWVEVLWEMTSLATAFLFVEGFCGGGGGLRCSNEGRALMQLDYRQFVVKLEKICGRKPLPHQDHVIQYIKAFYIPETELESWVKYHTEYSAKQLVSLVNSVAYSSGGNKTKQKLNTLITEFSGKIRR